MRPRCARDAREMRLRYAPDSSYLGSPSRLFFSAINPGSSAQFAADDPSLPAFWNAAVVGQFKKGERAELTVAAELFAGAGGGGALGVPPSSDVKLTVELVGWLDRTDISAGGDRSMLKAALSKVATQ